MVIEGGGPALINVYHLLDQRWPNLRFGPNKVFSF
jgi:hypothetical protein